MTANIISDYKQPNVCPEMIQFSVVFTSVNGRKEEYIFFDLSISDCLHKCAAFINYMFQIQGMDYVYIFPVNCTDTYRYVYKRSNGMKGRYKIIKCEPDYQLTFFQVRIEFLGS